MGIPYYFYTLIKTYPDILVKTPPSGVKVFYIDYNASIHPIAAEVVNSDVDDNNIENAIFEKLWKTTLDDIILIKPSDETMLCIDGVAPLAKMIQQRNRRYLSAFRIQLGAPESRWDSTAISPGTPFMNRLSSFLEKNRTSEITISAADKPGEGEHKIFIDIMQRKNDKIIIKGMDADLIMLSLLCHDNEIYIMRDNDNYLNINILRSAILTELQSKYQWNYKDPRQAIDHYVILCILLGNDFVPHMPCLSLQKNGHDRLLAATTRFYKHDITINALIANTLIELSKSEDSQMQLIVAEYIRTTPYKNNNQDPYDSYPILNKDPVAEVIASRSGPAWRNVYYKKLLSGAPVATACKLYIQGIYWVFNYYKRLPIDSDWYYPYAYAPTMCDLSNQMNGMRPVDFKDLLKNFTGIRFVSPEVQLLCIMPYISIERNVLPDSVAKIMKNEKYKYLFPRKFQVHTFLHKHLWETTIILAPVNIKILESLIPRTNITSI